MPDDGVTYSFKDLFDKFDDRLQAGFDKLDRRLDQIVHDLASKADVGTVRDLEKRIIDHESRVDERFKPLELASAGAQAVSKTQQRAVNAILLLASGGVGALIYLLVGGHP